MGLHVLSAHYESRCHTRPWGSNGKKNIIPASSSLLVKEQGNK